MEENYKTVDEFVFELPSIKKGKKSIIGSFCAFAIGIGMIIWCYLLPDNDGGANLSSSLLLMGTIAAAAGAIVTVMRLSSKKGVPYFIPTGQALKRREVFYDEKYIDRIKTSLEAGDLKALSEIPKGNHSAIILVSYCDRNCDIAVCQLQRYVPHYFAPVHPAVVFNAPEAVLVKSMY